MGGGVAGLGPETSLSTDKVAGMSRNKVIREFKKLDVELQDFILQQIDFLVDFQNKKVIKREP
ncbi:hypothetical protein FACS1894109_20410 [Spirochaetia bacterium]|nr:hypothetical protein FACS1894109_20410 [Spirochaetia bacterium]